MVATLAESGLGGPGGRGGHGPGMHLHVAAEVLGMTEGELRTVLEADGRLADLEARITERIESPLPERPARPGRPAPAESD